jgi:hypothetical protein
MALAPTPSRLSVNRMRGDYVAAFLAKQQLHRALNI